MRKIKDKVSHLRLQRRRTRRNERQRRRRKKRIKHIRRLLHKKSKADQKSFLKTLHEYGENRVRAPKIFSLLSNTEETVRFLQRINSFWQKRKNVFIVLREVETIDHSATTTLLALVSRFHAIGAKVSGDFPANTVANKIIRQSQFFEQIQKISPSSKDYTLKRDNQIIGEAGTQTIDRETALSIREDVSQTITSSANYAFTTLHPMFMELMQNTYEHASEDAGTVHWWLSMNHDKDKKTVSFHFIDYGRGIVDSVLKKENNRITAAFKTLAITLFNANQSSDIISRLLKNEHKKQTYYRGKGIPSLKEALDKKRIKCLSIITNKAFVDVAGNIARDLQTDFTGTYITWVLNNECEKKIWNKK